MSLLLAHRDREGACVATLGSLTTTSAAKVAIEGVLSTPGSVFYNAPGVSYDDPSIIYNGNIALGRTLEPLTLSSVGVVLAVNIYGTCTQTLGDVTCSSSNAVPGTTVLERRRGGGGRHGSIGKSKRIPHKPFLEVFIECRLRKLNGDELPRQQDYKRFIFNGEEDFYRVVVKQVDASEREAYFKHLPAIKNTPTTEDYGLLVDFVEPKIESFKENMDIKVIKAHNKVTIDCDLIPIMPSTLKVETKIIRI